MNNELYHHGILGMKWGVRRTPEQLGYRTKTSTATRTNSIKQKTVSKNSSVKTTAKKTSTSMTDEELRAAINRLQLEKQYRDLTRAEVSAGKKWVMSVLSEGAKKAATNYVSNTLTKVLDQTFKSESSDNKKKSK